MVISQVLLLILVVQWIRSQYRVQREILVNELTSLYIDSRNEVVDTMLFEKYVRPVVSNNRRIVQNRHIKGTDSAGIETEVVSIEQNVPNGRESHENFIVTAEVNPMRDSSGTDTLKVRRMSDAMIIRTVRLMYSHNQDTTGEKEEKEFKPVLRPDTAEFVTDFQNRLQYSGMKFKITWSEKPDIVINPRHIKELTIGQGKPFGLPEASVTSYSVYLVRKVSPQIIFGLVLLFVTGLAFRLSYLNVREHMILNDLRNEFVSNLTHELKTPVATLSVALESLGKYGLKNDSAAIDEYIRLASLETKRLDSLINRVLNQTALEQKGTTLEIERFDINAMIREIADIMKLRLDNAGTIEFLPEEKNLYLDGDPLFLKEVIVNLIDNSIKYSDKTPVITIESKKNNKAIIISVNDNGPGIPQEYHKKIFEKFFRLPTANVHNVKGYGLGLSFATLVMHLHKGEINVKNLNPGSSFVLKLPLA
jgi:signal transduction histidine kinase